MLGGGSNLSHELKQIASSTQVQSVNGSNMMAYSISFSVWLLAPQETRYSTGRKGMTSG